MQDIFFNASFSQFWAFYQCIYINMLGSDNIEICIYFSYTYLKKHDSVLCILHFVIWAPCHITSGCLTDHMTIWTKFVKACVRYFLSNLYFFTKWWHFKNCEKCFLFHLKSSFHSWDIQLFVIFPHPFHTDSKEQMEVE